MHQPAHSFPLVRKASIAVVLAGVLSPAAALGDGKRIAQLNHQALEEYDLLEFARARATLEQAVRVATDEALLDEPHFARTQMLLAAVYVVGFKDLARGTEWMKKALAADPSLEITVAIVNKTVHQIYARAKSELAAERAAFEARLKQQARERAAREAAEKARAESERLEAIRRAEEAADSAKRAAEHARLRKIAESERDGGDEGEEERENEDAKIAELATPIDPDTVEGLRCPRPNELVARRPAALRCALDKAVDAAVVFAFHRVKGGRIFKPQLMKRNAKGWWEVVLQGEAVNLPGLEVYFEARSRSGKAIAADGNPGSPKLFPVKGATAGGGAGAGASGAAESVYP